MVQWWQAVLIALASALMTGTLALVVQVFQQRHDNRRQQREFEADKVARREEAARQQSRDQAKPFYEFIELVELDQGRRLLKSMMTGQGGRRIKDNVWNVVSDVIEESAWEPIWNDLVLAETWPTERWQDIVRKYSGRFLTVQDVRFRDTLLKLMGHYVGREQSTLAPSDVSQLILEARSILADKIVNPYP